MYINIEIRTASADMLRRISEASETEPIIHQSVSCGYNSVNVVYSCSKNEISKIKNHWKSRIPECLIVTI